MSKRTHLLKLDYGLKLGETLSGSYIRHWGAGKSAFLQDAEAYLKTLAQDIGWNKHPDKHKAVCINPSGTATAGDVTASLFPDDPSQKGIYLQISDYCPWLFWEPEKQWEYLFRKPEEIDYNKEVGIMYRVATRSDLYGTCAESQNHFVHGSTPVPLLIEKIRELIKSHEASQVARAKRKAMLARFSELPKPRSRE